MRSTEIRQKFLDFFSGNDHTIVSSSSLVPEKDPSLLFVNAGMVQFKNTFLGIEKREYPRATSCQKCVRAGGKHNDLENIGRTLRHHTFFEMLGNFSFGNYFKAEAIGYAWEFLRRDLSLDKERLWITVFEKDDEAEALWKKAGVSADRIVRLGEKDNFWSMGDEGPCGPCSEILYDLGPHVGCKTPDCKVGCDCDRYLEIWNLVFMEYERSRDGTMTKLPKPSIDTGMGLERITSVLQGKIGSYETDLFLPLIERLEDIARCAYGEDEKTDIAMRVIVDHVRGSSFIINDGVLPSKDGRGYVLRRIIRRALRYGKKIGIDREFLYDLSSVVVDVMDSVYPEIRQNHPYIVRVLKGEEERFMETLNVGMRLYDEMAGEIRSKNGRVIPGDLVYKLYDTYGFPLDLTEEMAEEDGLVIDAEGFERALEEQKTRSRTGSRIKGEGWSEGHVAILKGDIRNEFVGYHRLDSASQIAAIVKDEVMVDRLNTGETGEIFVHQTPFYGESGGQVGDEGAVLGPRGRGTISDVMKVKDDLFSHRVVVEEGELAVGDSVELTVDVEKRKGVSRNHTATHLLQYALRTVLGSHVKQSGSLVEKDRLRFDFTHFQSLSDEEIDRVEEIVNDKIMECNAVETDVKNRDDAIRSGATALFEEKYGDTVRVVQICDFSTELCGGTHVRNTGEIGSFAIITEVSLAYGVRRIEAVTGRAALEYRKKLERTIRNIAKSTSTELDKVEDKVDHILRDLQQKQKELEKLKGEMAKSDIDDAIGKAPERNGVRIVTLLMPEASADQLRKATDVIRSKVDRCVAAVASASGEKGMIIVAVSKDVQQAHPAGGIVKRLAEKFGAKGGGGPQIAQGGLPAHTLQDALRLITEWDYS